MSDKQTDAVKDCVKVSIVLPKALADRVFEAAEANRRSRTGEIEVRLDASFREEDAKREGGAA